MVSIVTWNRKSTGAGSACSVPLNATELAAIRRPTILYIVRKCKSCKQITVNKSPTGLMPPVPSIAESDVFITAGETPCLTQCDPSAFVFDRLSGLNCMCKKGAFIVDRSGSKQHSTFSSIIPADSRLPDL